MTITITAQTSGNNFGMTGYSSQYFIDQFAKSTISSVAPQLAASFVTNSHNLIYESITVQDNSVSPNNTYNFTGPLAGESLGAYLSYFDGNTASSYDAASMEGTFFTGNAAGDTITGLEFNIYPAFTDYAGNWLRLSNNDAASGDSYYLEPLLGATTPWSQWTGMSINATQFWDAIFQYGNNNTQPLVDLLNAQQYNFVGHDSANNALGDITTRDDTYTGGNLADTIRGFGGNDFLDGGAGADFIDGGNGNDYIVGGLGNDTLAGGLGNDHIEGGAGNDVIRMDSGADYIDGGFDFNTLWFTNATVMNFNSGTFTGDAAGDTWLNIQAIRGSAFGDTIFADQTNTNVARFYGDGGNDWLGGGAGGDILHGDAGFDRIWGFGGNDTLQGGLGDDLLYGGTGIDTADFSDHRGADRFLRVNTVGWTIDLVHGVATTATRATVGFTTETDIINSFESAIGSIGNDTIFVANGAGGGTFDGRSGTDTLWVGATHANTNILTGVTSQVANDDVINMDSGIDSFTARDGIRPLTYTTRFSSIEVIHANVGNDTVYGTLSAQGDTIYGDAGNDRLFGLFGRDTLVGGVGSDAITGGLERDVMTGGAGALTGDGARDTFFFNFTEETGRTTATCDVITDFTQGTAVTADRINLAAIDANTLAAAVGNQAFTWQTAAGAAFTGVAGQLHYAQSGGNTYISGDTNGDKVADFMIGLTGLHALAATDFIL
jgi:Ca2+-binding RTX toxin-like protein